MNTFAPDPSNFTKLTGAYYPTGHMFAMFNDLAAVQTAAARIAELPGVGAVSIAPGAAIESAFGQRAAEVGGSPSVGREDQFMLRFVELARAGKCGLLIDMGVADGTDVAHALGATGAQLAYHYRALVIDELVEPTRRAEAAAAGKL